MIEQKIYYTENVSHKKKILDRLLSDEEINRAIIFTSTKSFADELVESLKEEGHKTAALHGDMKQSQRTRTIHKLREGKIKILVATDVAARGIDIESITHVVNFDFPRKAEDYVHRIGRTGRAGQQGTAFSLVGKKDAFLIPEVESYTGQKIKIVEIPGLEPSTKYNRKRSQPKKRWHPKKKKPMHRSFRK